MGGKGGGGNSEPGWMPYWRADQERIAKEKLAADTAAFDAKTKADKAAKAQAAADKAAADKAASDKAAADKTAADKVISDKAAADKLARETPLGPAIQAGGAITQPTPNPLAAAPAGLASDANTATGSAGNVLGGAVLSPPSYWNGGGGYGPRTPRQSSSLRTTNV
jgi:membrane protein involved in colicin uptake